MNGTTLEIMLRPHSGLAQLPNTTLHQALSHRDAENRETQKKLGIFCESSFQVLIQRSKNPLSICHPSEAKHLTHAEPRLFASVEAPSSRHTLEVEITPGKVTTNHRLARVQ